MSYSVEPMRLSDVPEIETIERQSFSSPWSRRAYEYDLKENALARYIVVREREKGEGEQSQVSSPRSQVAVSPLPRIVGVIRSLLQALGIATLSSGDLQPATSDQPPILGFAGLWMAVGEAHLVTLAVKPEYRRRGLGELLLVSALDLTCQLHASCMILEVRASNLIAKQLYEKYGFTVSRIRKGYYSDNGEDAIEMIAEGIAKAQFQARLQSLKKLLAGKLTAHAS